MHSNMTISKRGILMEKIMKIIQSRLEYLKTAYFGETFGDS